MCSKKLAAPLVLADSAREPASIQTPTVAAPAEGFSSVATVRPLGKLVMRVAEACLAAVAKGRTNYENFCEYPSNQVESCMKSNLLGQTNVSLKGISKEPRSHFMSKRLIQ